MRTFFLLALLINALLIQAQNLSDALIYSDSEIQGTARFRALSGAMGALGGDPSAINANPASSSVFNTSYAAISTAFANTENNATFMDKTTLSDYSKLSLPQAGIALVFKNSNSNSPWKKVTLGLAYDKTKSHNQNWLAKGINTNSIANYFLAQANGLDEGSISILRDNDGNPIESITDAYIGIGEEFGYQNQQAFLGYESYILDPPNSNNIYASNVYSNSNKQHYNYLTSGANGKFSFNLSGQYEDKLYLGINVNSHFIDYNRIKTLTETNTSDTKSINYIKFRNTLNTSAGGLSIQLGAIAKLSEGLRLGFSYNSPTWYEVEEKTTDFIKTASNKGIKLDNNTTFKGITIAPETDNIYPIYKLQTPWHATGSLAYVFKKKGLINIDYTLKDYTAIKFRPLNEIVFEELNSAIKDNFRIASIIRIGSEYRLDKNLSIRAGYFTEQSPYKNNPNYGDTNGYSAGLGYKFGNKKLDITYNNTRLHNNTSLYNVGLTNKTYSRFNTSNITLTFGVHL